MPYFGDFGFRSVENLARNGEKKLLLGLHIVEAPLRHWLVVRLASPLAIGKGQICDISHRLERKTASNKSV